MSRTYPHRPIVGVGAVVIHNGHVLLVRRASPPSPGRWSLPGGVVELGETMREALVREVLEECGVLVEPERVVGVFDVIRRDKEGAIRYHYVLVDYRARYIRGQPQPSDDASEAGWVPLERLDSMDILELSKRLIQKVSQGQDLL